MPRTAICACGQATITVDADPVMHGVCHCTNCKRRTGSAFGISAYFPRSSVVARHGETSVYAFRHEAQQHDQARHFCARCGTTLFWTISTLPDLVGIAGGCFAGDGLPEPSFSTAHANKETWVTLPASWKVAPG
jgi:hypothetical protein